MIKIVNSSLNVKFYEDTYHKDFSLDFRVDLNQLVPGKAEPKENQKVLDLVSNNKKIYFHCNASIYPFLTDLDSLLSFYEDEEMVNDVEAIIDIREVGNNNFGHWLPEILSNKKIKYRLVNLSGYQYIDMNNFFIIHGLSFTENGVFKNLYDNTLSFVSNEKNVKPFRKVFISRKFAYADTTNIRIDDHEKLEQIFINNDFEICYPEVQFKTFSEQVTYFNETKVLCGISGGGLTNSVFMQPKGKILELLTSFRFNYLPPFSKLEPQVTEELHEYYLHIAFQKKHTLVTLSNVDREVDEIEKELKRTGVLDWLAKDD